MTDKETVLEMVGRHVREGAAHLERQRLLIARLERSGRVALVVQAKKLLIDFEEVQQAHENHLERILTEMDDQRGATGRSVRRFAEP